MSKIDDGGQAFPNTYPIESSASGTIGMSLRDWFAGMAMRGVVTAGIGITVHPEAIRKWIAEESYALADAMIAARKSDPESESYDTTNMTMGDVP